MYVVRPVEIADIAALEALAAVTMPGVHTPVSYTHLTLPTKA